LKVLLIDDDPLIERAFRTGLASTTVELTVVQSRESALDALEEDFDLVVCDLKLPTAPGGEPQVIHGLATCDDVRERAPGVPVLILSGFGTLDDLEDRLAGAPPARFLGSDERPLLRHLKKDRLDEAIASVAEHAEELERLRDEIEIAWGSDPNEIDRLDRQLLRLYARQRRGAVIRLRRFTGGRSGAQTLWMEIEDADRGISARGVAKLDNLSSVTDEERRFREHVAPLLPAGSFAGSIEFVKAGAGSRGGLFYSLAADYDRTLFNVLETSPEEAAEIVRRLFAKTESWHKHPIPKRLQVRDVRRAFISDDALAEVRAQHGEFLDFDIETGSVWVNLTRTHGDLHGGNILISPVDDPILIDYGRVGYAPAATDPVTLEVSTLVHPDAGLKLAGWPTDDQARSWESPEYVAGSPIQPFIASCREWLIAVTRGDRERDATLFGYALRQLQYPGCPAALVIALSQGCAARLADS
jgi:CheY-like chemotaxis protein